MPEKTRESPFSSAASENPRKLRVTPGSVRLVVEKRTRSPNRSINTSAAAEPTSEWVDGYSGTGGVTRNGCHAGSGSVRVLPSAPASWIAETGRQKRKLYFSANPAI